MKKLLLVFIIIALSIITLQSASAAVISGQWMPEEIETKTITLGESTDFDWLAHTAYFGLDVTIWLKEGSTVLKTLESVTEPELLIEKHGTITIGPEDYIDEGTYTVELYATDIVAHFYTDTITLIVEEPVNNLLEIYAPNNMTVPEHNYLESSFTVIEPDGDSFTCGGIEVPDWLTVTTTADGCILSGTAPEVDADTEFIMSIYATDEHGLTDSVMYKVTVLDVPVINENPIAAFDWTPQNPTTCTQINFDASSSYDNDGSIASYAWDLDDDGQFDDGNTATLGTMFTEIGDHLITLKVVDNKGADDTIDHVVTVAPCDSDFTDIVVTANPDNGDAPLTVDFTCTVTGGNEPIDYAWDFGDDSGTSTEQNPTYTYTDADIYTATCTAEDADINADEIDGTVVVTVTEPNNDFTDILVTATPDEGDAPLSVSLDCVATGADEPFTYDWDVDDDGVFEITGASTGATQHIYVDSGVYTARCVAHDADTDEIDGSVIITATEPVINLPPEMLSVPDQFVDELHYFSYQLIVSDPDNTREELECFDVKALLKSGQYLPDWLVIDPETCIVYGTAPEVIDDQTILVEVGVRDPEGLEDTQEFNITILDVEQPNPLTAQASVNPEEGYVPLDVVFTCVAADGVAPYAFAWTISGVVVATTASFTHTFDEVGDHVAKCTVTDDAGDTASSGAAVEAREIILENNPPVIDPVSDYEHPEETYYEITFDVSDVDDDALTCFSAADVGYGHELPAWLTLDKQTCTLSGTTPSVDVDETFRISVGVKDEHGLTDETYYYLTVKNVPVENMPPIASFDWTPLFPTTCTEVTFDAASSSDVDGTIIKYAWDLDRDDNFDDATGITFSRTFATTGNHLVRLKVTDDDGDAKILSRWVVVAACNYDLEDVTVIADPDTGYAPLDVDLMCTATGGNAPLKYSWDIDNDGVYEIADASTGDASWTYTAIGTYVVKCTVEDGDGDALSGTDTVVVTQRPPENVPPVADFDWSPENPEACDTITFDAASSSDTDGTIDSYAWDLDGDGQYDDATGVAAAKMFTQGNHLVRLKVTDDDGALDTVSKWVSVAACDVDILDVDLVADPDVGYAALPVDFTCTVTGGNAPMKYSWDMNNDGTYEFTNKVSNELAWTYTTPGVYRAICTATDADGDMLSGDTIITVNERPPANVPPVADFDWSPENPETCDTVTFDAATSYDVDGAVVAYAWDLDGDGYYGEGSGVTASRNFAHPGNYLVRLKVTDDDGVLDTLYKWVSVAACDYPITAIDVTGNPSSGDAPLVVDFTCTATGGNAPISYSWTFGDGSTSATQNPSYTYTAVGTYTATCTAEDTDGDRLSGTVQTVVTQEELFPPVADFTWSPVLPEDGQLVSFDGSASYDADGTIVAYAWDFDNDGVWDKPDVTANTVFNAPGSYMVTLRVTDNDGLIDTVTKMVVVQESDDPFSTIDFTATPQSGDTPLDVSFACDTTGGNAPISYLITFGDGYSVTGTVAQHTYVAPGTYVATCTATDDDGDTISDSETIVVTEPYVPEKPQCSDGRDNDGDGLIDFPEDPGCYGPNDPKEYNTGGDSFAGDLRVLSISTYGQPGYEKACAGDVVVVEVVLQNDAGVALDDLRVGFSVPELGVQQKSSQFDMRDGLRKTKSFQVYVPYDALLGDYYTEITVANDDVRRSLHRMLEIVC